MCSKWVNNKFVFDEKNDEMLPGWGMYVSGMIGCIWDKQVDFLPEGKIEFPRQFVLFVGDFFLRFHRAKLNNVQKLTQQIPNPSKTPGKVSHPE